MIGIKCRFTLISREIVKTTGLPEILKISGFPNFYKLSKPADEEIDRITLRKFENFQL